MRWSALLLKILVLMVVGKLEKERIYEFSPLKLSMSENKSQKIFLRYVTSDHNLIHVSRFAVNILRAFYSTDLASLLIFTAEQKQMLLVEDNWLS